MINLNSKKLGIVLSYLTQAISIFSGIIYTPLMLRLLGQSEYGLYQLVNSVVSYLGLISFGFSSSYLRYYSKFKIANDNENVARLNGMFLVIFSVMAAICLICGSIMVFNIREILGTGLTEAELGKARILFVLLLISLAITFPKSVFGSIILSQEKFVFLKITDLLYSVFNPFLSLPLLLLGFGSVGMVFVSFFLTLVTFCLFVYYSLRKLNSHFLFNNFDFSLFKDLWQFTFFIFLNQVIDQINWNIDKLLLGRFINTAAVAIYGVGFSLQSMYTQFANSVSSVFVPKVNILANDLNKKNELNKIFVQIGRMQFAILSLALTGLIVFGKPFIYFWAGPEYTDSFFVALILIIPITFPLIQNIGIEIQRAMNKHQARSIVYFFIALGNLLISIPLIKFLGPIGAALGTGIALVLGNILFMNWYYYKKIGLDIFMFWKNIFSMTPPVICSLALGLISSVIFDLYRFNNLIILIIIYSCVFILLMYKYGFNNEEKQYILIPLKKMFNK